MGCCCTKQRPELSDAVTASAPSQPPRPPAPAAPALPAASQETSPEKPKSIATWSTDEVGKWLEGPTVNLGQYRQKLAAMGVDGFMVSRMKPEDLEDVVPVKTDRLAIVNAAKEELKKNGPAQTGARTDYGKVLGHDRDD